MIDEHKPAAELNNNNNNNNNSNNRAEWKIQLSMQNSFLSTRSFEETRTIYTKSEPVKIFMGSKTEDAVDKIFNTLLQRFQKSQETSNGRGSEFIPDTVELFSKNRHYKS